ncbi:MAG: cupredoxin domain-containing protein [Chloroflexota bacterium]|nr:cupredoxin domain-containing protein [Chloroflexota bacterium]
MAHLGTGSKRWFGLLAALGLLLFGGGLGLAQDATPAPVAAHPAHIHSGTCDTLGDVVFPLEDVTAQPPATPVSSTATGAESVAEASTSTVEVALDDVLAAEHAINVHLSADEIGTYIVCGDVTGEPTDGMLEIELLELDGSGYSGTATLLDNDDGTTTVTIAIIQVASAATPAASPAASGDAASEVTVEITDFAYGAASVTIPVGGSVTWTNNDSAPHTATAQDREVLQTGTLNQGESYIQAFDTPGTYEYFCEFHPNMSGTVIVE